MDLKLLVMHFEMNDIIVMHINSINLVLVCYIKIKRNGKKINNI